MSTDIGMLQTFFPHLFLPTEAFLGPYLGHNIYKHENVNLRLVVTLDHFPTSLFLLISAWKKQGLGTRSGRSGNCIRLLWINRGSEKLGIMEKLWTIWPHGKEII